MSHWYGRSPVWVRVCISRYCLQVKAAGHDRHWNGLPWTGAQHIYYSGGEPARTLDALALRRSRRGPVAARRVLRSKSFATLITERHAITLYRERFGGEAECEWREAWAGGASPAREVTHLCASSYVYWGWTSAWSASDTRRTDRAAPLYACACECPGRGGGRTLPGIARTRKDALALRPVHTQKRVTHVADAWPTWPYRWPPAHCQSRPHRASHAATDSPPILWTQFWSQHRIKMRCWGAKNASLRRLHYRFCEWINIHEEMIKMINAKTPSCMQNERNKRGEWPADY